MLLAYFKRSSPMSSIFLRSFLGVSHRNFEDIYTYHASMSFIFSAWDERDVAHGVAGNFGIGGTFILIGVSGVGVLKALAILFKLSADDNNLFLLSEKHFLKCNFLL